MPGVRSHLRTLDYPALLASAWAKHLAPRTEGAPTVVSTFAGCGGSSLGYSIAGYRELLAVEWDDNAVETFRLNFPGVDVHHGDIAALTVADALRRTGLQPGELDVLDGSPPCQGFSTAGKRILDDPRNQLFREYVRLLRGLQPRAFVMENVSGMVKGSMKLVFAEAMRELKASGYRVSCRLLNAMYFNVPQSRERLIFIGVREDLGLEPSHPKAEAAPITVGWAWDGMTIPPDEMAYANNAIISVHNSIAPVLQRAKQGVKLSSIEARGYYWNWIRLHMERVSPTIPKTDINLCHPFDQRIITPTEAKRLSSFPDSFQLLGNPKDQRERIGNSVPPLLMASIAGHVRGLLNGARPTAPLQTAE